MFQAESIEPDQCRSMRVRFRHFHDDYLYASIFNPCSVNAYCELDESYTPQSEWKWEWKYEISNNNPMKTTGN